MTLLGSTLISVPFSIQSCLHIGLTTLVHTHTIVQPCNALSCGGFSMYYNEGARMEYASSLR